jgi:integrase
MPTKKSSSRKGKPERGLQLMPNGKWCAVWYYKGRRITEWFDSKTEAKAARAKAVLEIKDGTFLTKKEIVQKAMEKAQKAMKEQAERKSFDNAVKLFLDEGRDRLRPSTQRDDERIGNIWLTHECFKGRLLREIRTADVHRYVSERLKTIRQRHGATAEPHVGKREVDLELSRLNRLFNLCVALELIDRNPAKVIEPFNEDRRRNRVLKPEEEQKLLSCAPPLLRDFILIAVYSGMRLGEILSLQWQHVDLERGYINVTAENAKGKRIRPIPINPVVRAVLAGIPHGKPNDMVLMRSEGKPVKTLYKIWGKALREAGITDLRIHDLRRTAASRLLNLDVHLVAIQEILGHRSCDTTRRYASLDPKHLKSAMDRLCEKAQTATSTATEEGNNQK